MVWYYILNVLKRAKLLFPMFMVGSIGSLLFLFFCIKPILAQPLTQVIAKVSSIAGHWLNLCESYIGNSMVMIQGTESAMAMVVDFECSGIIEIFVFLSLLMFFPVYRMWEKFGLALAGIIYICVANVLRILLISFIVSIWGNEAFYFAHSILARIVFYSLSVVLYFYVFTKGQILRQKVGNVRYESV